MNLESAHSEMIKANGLDFHAMIQGTGQAVLMLHGFPENWYSWRYQIPALAEAGYKAVAVDLRGYNKSSRPGKVADYHVDHHCDDIFDLIRALGAEKVHLVGHDWGGAIAWTYASRKPETLHSLSILNAPHPKVFQQHLTRNFRQMMRSWYMLFFQIPWLPEFLIRLNADNTFTRTFRGWARRKEMFPDDVISVFKKAMLEPGALTAGINYYRATARDPNSMRQAKDFPDITVPTQVIWGDNDKALGKELCDDIHKHIDAPYELHFIPGCSHWVQQEEPEKVNEHLLSFLNRVD